MGKILQADGAPWDRGTGTEAEALKRVPLEGPFHITDELLAGLSAQQEAALREEWFNRQGSARFAFPCERVPEHNLSRCSHCWGSGLHFTPGETTTSPCSFCDGTGSVITGSIQTFGCRHVYPQDEDKPVGLILMPKRYYVCRDCFKLIERKRFRFGNEIGTRCWKCINEESHRLAKINPELVLDLSVKK